MRIPAPSSSQFLFGGHLPVDPPLPNTEGLPHRWLGRKTNKVTTENARGWDPKEHAVAQSPFRTAGHSPGGEPFNTSPRKIVVQLECGPTVWWRQNQNAENEKKTDVT